MPQSLASILIHLIFSTKNRERTIGREIRPRLHAYIIGILDKIRCPSLQTGGTADHVHVLLSLARVVAVADVVEQVKTGSSKWMKDQGVSGFVWQAGYGAFSVGESQKAAVTAYIARQEEHHRTITFQEEYRRFLARYRVGYEERYVWD